jgi:hypothetical protein
MDWVKWIIPLIVIALYILGHLASMQREQPRRPMARSPQPPPDPDERAKRRPASSDLESFLDEMRQRKRLEEEPVLAEESSRPLPRHEPRRGDERSKSRAVGSKPPQTKPPQTKPPQRRTEPVVVVQPMPVSAAPPSLPAVRSTTPTITIKAATPMAPPPPPARPAAPQAAPQRLDAPTVTAKPVSPLAGVVVDLLKSRQSLAAAFLLREILDRPLSQRCRR